jgi:hypothetical protein
MSPDALRDPGLIAFGIKKSVRNQAAANPHETVMDHNLEQEETIK